MITPTKPRTLKISDLRRNVLVARRLWLRGLLTNGRNNEYTAEAFESWVEAKRLLVEALKAKEGSKWL